MNGVKLPGTIFSRDDEALATGSKKCRGMLWITLSISSSAFTFISLRHTGREGGGLATPTLSARMFDRFLFFAVDNRRA